MSFKGAIIEESLDEKSVLNDVKIVSTKVYTVTDEHETPWLKQWTIHIVEVPSGKAKTIAEKISRALSGDKCNWYADFKSDREHYVIFKNKVFLIDRSSKPQYKMAIDYAIEHGVPVHQADFMALI